MNQILIGLASNSKPKEHLCEAFSHLKKHVAIVETSPVVSGPSRDGTQRVFYNALVFAKTSQAFTDLRQYFERLENSHGRQKNAFEVTLDVDLLAYKGEETELFLSPDLEEADVTYLAQSMKTMPVSFYKKDRSDVLFEHVAWRLDALESKSLIL